MAELLQLLSLTIFLYITSGATDPFPLESSTQYLEDRVDGLNYSNTQEIPVGKTYYERDECLIRTNHSFGATGNGEIELLAHSCDLHPIQVPVGGDFKYLFPTESKIKILCRSYPNNTCVKHSHYLWSDNRTHVEGLPLNDYETEFTVDFLLPFGSRMWMVCYCDNTEGKKLHVGPISMMYSNYIPRPVSDFDCVVYDFLNAKCTWNNQSELQVNWTACVGLSRTPNSSYHDCGNRHETKIEIPSIHWQGRYVAIINGTNEYGATTTTFNFTMDQVQLSKANATLGPIGSKGMVVQYNHNCTLNPNYRLCCQEDGLHYKITIAVNETMTPDLENINEAERNITIEGVYSGDKENKKWVLDFVEPFFINITYLMPYTIYKITIIQRIGASELWSEPTTRNFRTSSANPTRGPFIHPTGFMQQATCINGRLVNVYWKGLGIHNGGNGVVTGYEVNNKLQPAAMRVQSVCIPLTDSVVSIYAVNEKGGSSTPSSLYIPSSENRIDIPTCMLRARMLRDEADKVILNWQLLTHHMEDQNITDATYTIFWCKFDDSMCQDEFDWLDVTGYVESQHVLTMKHNRTEYKYGISVSHGELHSGILWADCLLGTAGTGQTDVTISVTPIDNNGAHVIVSPQCVDGMGMLEKTRLTYCPIGEENNCVDDLPPALGHCSMEYEVLLKPGVEYSFMLARTYSDIPDAEFAGPSVSPFVLNNKDEANKKTIIISVVTAVVIVMVLSISCGLCYVRRKRKQSKKLTVITIKPTDMGLMVDKIEPDMESLCSNEHSSSYLSYKVAGPIAALSPQVEADETNRPLINELDICEQTTEKTGLMHQMSTESEMPVDSDYGTGTENSGNSLVGYTKVADIFLVPKPGSELLDSEEMCLPEDINSASSDGSLFHGATLEDIMKQKSSLQAVKEEVYPEPSDDYMAVTKILTEKSVSTESVQTALHSGYVKVDHINGADSGDSAGQLSDDYVQVHSTQAKQEMSPDMKPSGYGNTKYSDMLAKGFTGDLTSAGTINAFHYDMDESGTSAIDMSQFLEQTTI